MDIDNEQMLNPDEYVNNKPEKPIINRRLMIEKIQLENFKSYYGQKEIGPLHKCFSSVVGPNGSGKSNLIECLLFVFGKRAKRMRLNKLSELIHNSAEHNDVNSATVRVFFQDIDDYENEPDYYEIVPNSLIIVARTVYRSKDNKDVSKYQINNSDATYKEVCELLSQKGIDLEHNRFLILQGEVEQISLMKPKAQNANETGLLEYLEDIIGSNKFVEKIQELETELDKYNDDKIEKTNRFKAAGIEMKSLEEDKNVAIEYLQKERTQILLTNMNLFVELGEGVQLINKSVQMMEERKTQAREIREKKKKMMEENREQVSSINTLMANDERAKEKEERVTAEFQTLERADTIIRNDLKQNMHKLQKAENAITILEKKKVDIIDESLKIENEIPSKERELLDVQNKRTQIEQKFEETEMKVRQTTEKLRKQKEKIDSELNPLINEFQQRRQDIDINKQKIQMSEAKFKKITDEKMILEDSFKANDDKLKQSQDILSKNSSELKELDLLLKENTNIQKQRKDNQDRVEKQLAGDKQLLGQMITSQKDAKNKNKVLTDLLNAQQRGLLSGICGRLGDLAAIDDQYDCAITTACPSLGHIGVEQVHNAEQCIKYLRDNKLGKATFMCLDKMSIVRKQREQQFNAPNRSQRLYDLVKQKDEKFADAFYFALRDTLVCEDLELARTIAYGQKRHRVVTENGNLIETSGTMSGGGNPQRGGMGSKVVEEYTEKDVKDIQNKIKELENEHSQILFESNQLSNAIKDLESRISQLKSECNKQQEIVVTSEKVKITIQDKLIPVRKQLESMVNYEKEVEDIKKESEEHQMVLSELSPKIKELKDMFAAIDSKILEVGGPEYKKQREEVDRISQKVNELERVITRMKTTYSQRDDNVQKIDTEIEHEKKEIQKTELVQSKLKSEISANEEAGHRVLAELGAVETERKETKLKLDGMKTNFNQMKREMQVIEEEEIKSKERVEEALKQKTQYEELSKLLRNKIKRNREKYQKLQEEFGFIFNNVNQDQNALVAVGDNRNLNSQRTSLVQQEEEKSEMSHNGKRMRRTEDFKYHLKNTDINYNFTEEEINHLSSDHSEIKERMVVITQELQDNIPNLTIIQTYRVKKTEYDEKELQLNQVLKQMADVKEEYDKLKKKRHYDFLAGFNIISTKLKEMYRLITNGGDAELETLDHLDPFSEGIQFQVRPLKKSWKQMSKLSGGEKTLSSLSLIFALHHYKPSPLYCMDEIDAALDYKNVAIVGNYIKKRARNSQFLIISLRNNMFELADKLIGIYKTFDITKTITINPSQMRAAIEKENNKQEDRENQNKQNQSNKLT